MNRIDAHEEPPRARALVAILMGLLWAVTVALYWPVGTHEFVPGDDQRYITHNPNLSTMLEPEGIKRAFSEPYYANYAPLTMLSYGLDYRLHGMTPRGVLLTNVLLHATASALLFAGLCRLTRRPGPSLFVAAVFALHPLHVESVAWASQRKDVLAGLAFSLALLAYAGFVRGRWRRASYLALVVAFVGGLLSKSTLVTLPFVLLLLDVWPLARLPLDGRGARAVLPRLLAEKVPLLVIAAAASATTVWAQGAEKAVMSLDRLPVAVRLINAPVAMMTYLAKAFWPTGLATFYPLDPTGAGWSAGLLSAAGLVAITSGAIALLRRAPCLAVGWLWFVGMLVPMIGLVQVGSQALADRYTYLPLTGLTMAVAFAAPDVWRAIRLPAPVLALTGVVVIGALALRTRDQLGHWVDGIALYSHALRVTEPSFVVHHNLGVALLEHGRLEEAAEQLAHADRLLPAKADNLKAWADTEQRRGAREHAIQLYRQALAADATLTAARVNLGKLLLESGRPADAVAVLHVGSGPGSDLRDGQGLGLLATAYAMQGQFEPAAEAYRQALMLAPDLAAAHAGLGIVLGALTRPREAATHLRRAIELGVDSPELRNALADAERAAVNTPAER